MQNYNRAMNRFQQRLEDPNMGDAQRNRINTRMQFLQRQQGGPTPMQPQAPQMQMQQPMQMPPPPGAPMMDLRDPMGRQQMPSGMQPPPAPAPGPGAPMMDSPYSMGRQMYPGNPQMWGNATAPVRRQRPATPQGLLSKPPQV